MNLEDGPARGRFRIWCGAAWTRRGWQWHWIVYDMALKPVDKRVSDPGQVARGWQPSWGAAMEEAARYRRRIIDERVYLLYS